MFLQKGCLKDGSYMGIGFVLFKPSKAKSSAEVDFQAFDRALRTISA
jgi:hypothetical protein